MPNHHQTLSQLFSKIQMGDATAFNEFFMHYHTKLLSFAQMYTNERETAEEVVSELFVKIWQNRTSLAEINRPEVYIFIAVKNASLNTIRAKQRRFSTLASERQQALEEVADDQAPFLAEKELNNVLDQAVAALPDQRRMIFLMIKNQGLKPRHVAEILGISHRTVESQLYKAVKTLAERLQGYLGYHPQGKGKKS